MRSFIVAMGILVVLLVGLEGSYLILYNLTFKNVETLEMVYRLVQEEKWAESRDVFLIFKEGYQKKEKMMKALVDHAEIDSIESSLIAVEEFIKARSKPDALDATARSIFLLRHIEQKNRFNVENVL